MVISHAHAAQQPGAAPLPARRRLPAVALIAGVLAAGVPGASMLVAVADAAAAASSREPAAREPVTAVAATAAPAAGPYASTYRAPAAAPTLIRGGTVLTGTGQRLDAADVLLVDGAIAAVGPNLQAPAGARVIDAAGRWVTPGIIDVHSHLGVYPTPSVQPHSDGNEATGPSTANVWAEHSVWPQDPGFETALEGGVTALQILPGSANLIGGRSVVLKNVPAATYQAMKFPGAPQGLKAACGENPKRVYGRDHKTPATRMANVAVYRQQWAEAQDYLREQEAYARKAANGDGKGDKDAKPPKRDLRLETLAAALKGELVVHQHCYRADEMAIILDVAQEFGFKVAAFHHASEAYKIADLLAERGVCAAMWADWWGFKLESYDGISENVAFVDAAPKGCAIVHSDSEEGIQRLNQEAAKAMTAGRRAGFDIRPEHAIEWLTANAARALGVADRTGTLEPGKMADVVVWSGDPFSVYARTEFVFVDGVVRYERAAPPAPPRSDFLLGQPALAVGGAPASAAASAPPAAARALAAATRAPQPVPAMQPGPAASPGPTLIRNARVHTLTAAGVREGVDVLLENGRIAAIGPALAAPAGAEIVDAAGRPLTPGLYAGLTVLGLEETGMVASAADETLKLGSMRPEFDVALAYNPDSLAVGVTRAAGMTYAVIAPAAAEGGSIVAGQGAVLPLDGTLEPWSRALFVALGGDAAAISGGSRAAQFMLLHQALVEARAPNRVSAHDERLLTPTGRQRLVEFLQGAGPIVFEVDRAADIRHLLDFARREQLANVVIAGGAEAWRLAPDLAAARIPVVLDPLADLPQNFDAVGATLENAARLERAGVRIAFSIGTGESHNARKLRQAAGIAVAYGLPRDAALAAITRVPAEIFGVADRAGVLAPGRPADVVLWSGDPLEVTTVAERVWIGGRPQSERTRQTELRDRYLEKLQRGEAR